MGTHAHASSEAVQVITGITPFRFRAQELCVREFTRILEKPSGHPLKKALDSASMIHNKFTPLSYLRHQSTFLMKELEENDAQIAIHHPPSPKHILKSLAPEYACVISSSVGSSKSRSANQKKQAKDKIESFINIKREESVLIFTDGSVCNRGGNFPLTLGFGACSAVLVPPDIQMKSSHVEEVSNITDNVHCEIHAISLAIKCLSHFILQNP